MGIPNNKNNKKNIILFVHNVAKQPLEELRRSANASGYDWKYMVLVDAKAARTSSDFSYFDIVENCDYSNEQSIARALLPYQDRLLAVTSRGEANIARMVELIPHVPYLRTPTGKSLQWSTDKLLMRRRLKIHDSKRTPKFREVKSNSAKERKLVKEKVGFPLIIKPSNLSTSILVSVCYHEEELERSLRNVFRKIKKIYNETGRTEPPRIIAEEYMDGVMYSIDSYVDSRGRVFHCPLVHVKTGVSRGHDDFYNYLRITPTGLKPESVQQAEDAAESAIHALGLRNTTAHVELMRVDNEWKIIEIGARIGGFRHSLHSLSCQIDHSLNDVLIRIPKKPKIPKKCKGYAATLKYYPDAEGEILSIKGIKKIQQLKSVKSFDQKLKVGDRVKYSKNGGKGVFDMTLYNDDRGKLLADIRRVEKLIQIKVKRKGQRTKIK